MCKAPKYGCKSCMDAMPTPSTRRRKPAADPDDIIDLTLTSPESDKPYTKPSSNAPRPESPVSPIVPSHVQGKRTNDEAGSIPLFVDDSEDEDDPDAFVNLEYPLASDDGAVLVL